MAGHEGPKLVEVHRLVEDGQSTEASGLRVDLIICKRGDEHDRR